MFTPIQRYKFFSLQIYPPLEFSKFFDEKVKFILRFIVYYITNTLQIYRLNSTIPNFEYTFFEKFLIPIFNRGGSEVRDSRDSRDNRESRESSDNRESRGHRDIFSVVSSVSFVPFVSVVLRCDVREPSTSKKYQIIANFIALFSSYFSKIFVSLQN